MWTSNFAYPQILLRNLISFGSDPDHKYPTTYLRKTFSLPEDPASLIGLTLDVRYDDGFVAYLNGVEVARGSMPTGEIAYRTLAHSHESGVFETLQLDAHAINLLQKGANVLAVEVHQDHAASQDLFWEARLTYMTPDMLTAAPPDASPPGGLYMGAVTVSVSCATADVLIRYTVDGTTPQETSAVYDAPLIFTTSTTLKTRAYALGYTPSLVSSFVYQRVEPDSDGDRLPDAWEVQWFGDTALYSETDDPDDDGASNYDEFISGTDPLDPRSLPFLSIMTENATPHVRFMTLRTDPDDPAYEEQNRYYALQYATGLNRTATVWSAETGLESIAADDTLHDYPVDTHHSIRFFRLRIWLAP